MTAATTLSVRIPQVETDRLILRAPRIEDLGAMADFYASERSHWVGGPCTRFEAWRLLTAGIGHWVLKGFGYWTVEEKSSGAVVGRIGLSEADGWPEIELGWHVYGGFEGRGYAYEGAMAARDHAYRVMGLPPLPSYIRADNARSRRLAERMGAVSETEGAVLGQPCLIYRHPKAGA